MSTSTEPTVIIVPREKFSCSINSLDSIIEHTGLPCEADLCRRRLAAPVPRGHRRTLHPHGFKLIRVERFLPHHHRTHVALRHVSGKYVVFVENDVVSPRTGSTLVAPRRLGRSS